MMNGGWKPLLYKPSPPTRVFMYQLKIALVPSPMKANAKYRANSGRGTFSFCDAS